MKSTLRGQGRFSGDAVLGAGRAAWLREEQSTTESAPMLVRQITDALLLWDLKYL